MKPSNVIVALVALSLSACTSELASTPATDTADIVAAERLSEFASASFLVSEGDTLFLANDSALYALPKSGGAVQPLAELPRGKVAGITADAERVFVLEHVGVDSYAVLAVPRAGGEVTTLSSNRAEGWTGSPANMPIAIHDGTLFWGECGAAFSATGYVRALSLTSAGATPQVVARAWCPKSLGFDGSYVYFTSVASKVRRAPLAGGPVEDVFPQADELLVAGEYIFFAHNSATPERNGTFRRRLDAPLGTDGAHEKISTSAFPMLGVHDGALVTTNNTQFEIVDPANGPHPYRWRKLWIENHASIRASAMDDDSVYWVSQEDSATGRAKGVYRQRFAD